MDIEDDGSFLCSTDDGEPTTLPPGEHAGLPLVVGPPCKTSAEVTEMERCYRCGELPVEFYAPIFFDEGDWS